MDQYERLDADIRANLSPTFVEALESRMHWEYSNSYDGADRRGERPPFAPDDPYGQMLLAQHMRGRGSFGAKALEDAALWAGGEVEHRLIPENGQRKIIASVGPFCFIAETVAEFPHRPEFAKYKLGLSRMQSAIRQLEFDFVGHREEPKDWTGRHLGVVLHGCEGGRFTRSATSLGMLRIAFPNYGYDSWIWAEDVLNSRIVERLGWGTNVGSKQPQQADMVAVRLKALSEIREKK